MLYRRLGRTELMVSETGLHADPLRGMDREQAVAVLRRAFARNVSVVAWSVSDALEDLEPVIAEAAGQDLGRLALVALLDQLPAAEDIGPQIEAVAVRLGDETAVDIVTFPSLPDSDQLAALAEVRARGVLRSAGILGAPEGSVPAGVDVVVGHDVAHGILPRRDGVGVMVFGESPVAEADCTLLPPAAFGADRP